jgi:hypothetical protein
VLGDNPDKRYYLNSEIQEIARKMKEFCLNPGQEPWTVKLLEGLTIQQADVLLNDKPN